MVADVGPAGLVVRCGLRLSEFSIVLVANVLFAQIRCGEMKGGVVLHGWRDERAVDHLLIVRQLKRSFGISEAGDSVSIRGDGHAGTAAVIFIILERGTADIEVHWRRHCSECNSFEA